MLTKIKDYIKEHRFKAIAYLKDDTYYYKKLFFKNKYLLVVKTCPYGMGLMTYTLGEYDTIDEMIDVMKTINARILI